MARYRMTSALVLSLCVLGLGLTHGCGGSGSGGSSGGMNVHLVDGPLSGFSEVNVNIQSVEIRGNGGWITLGTPNKTINLLSLVGGVEESLAHGASLPEGTYSQMRLVLGAGNTVKLADGSVKPLTVPSGLQTGIKLIVNFKVDAGTTKDVFIDFDAAHSIQLVNAGASAQYILRPTVWAYDKVVTGSISGKLTDDAATPNPIGGAFVMAEVVDGGGNAMVSRRVQTAADGTYTLDLLPVGYTYYVVSQPQAGTTSYGAKASQGFALSSTTPTFTFNASFTAATTGGVAGAITPVASSTQTDQMDLLQSLSTGSGTQTFVVGTTLATLGSGTESYNFSLVPAGTYAVRGTRITANSDGTSTSGTPVVSPSFTVAAGATTTQDLGL